MNPTNQARVAVVGATGYAGAEVVRLLSGHPSVTLACVTSEKDSGKPLGAVHRHLGCTGLRLVKADAGHVAGLADLAFVALPHGASTHIVRELVEAGVRVVDLGADFRFTDKALYEKWYGEHGAAGLLETAVYGLTEFERDRVRDATLVANPGCYPTGALLGLLPLAARIVGAVFVDSKSGTSGAGRAAATNQLFAEVTENVRPYSVWRHRHQPEMQNQLDRAGSATSVLFSPHLLPIARGLLTACYFELAKGDELSKVFESAYATEPFVRVLGEGVLPEPRDVRGTNLAEIGWVTDADADSGRVAVFTAIDNLGKGAAGQAVQNMNCMLGMDELAGLDQVAALP